ncbi:uncharacterized protein [Macaca fascicularis]|uniref:uncharacterized protein n=1 Tax=Macaca fascicularis TaxID=9541 RepID=UPI003D15916E
MPHTRIAGFSGRPAPALDVDFPKDRIARRNSWIPSPAWVPGSGNQRSVWPHRTVGVAGVKGQGGEDWPNTSALCPVAGQGPASPWARTSQRQTPFRRVGKPRGHRQGAEVRTPLRGRGRWIAAAPGRSRRVGASHPGQFRSSFRGTCFSHLNRVAGSAPGGGAAGSQRIPPGSAKEVSISSRGRIDTEVHRNITCSAKGTEEPRSCGWAGWGGLEEEMGICRFRPHQVVHLPGMRKSVSPPQVAPIMVRDKRFKNTLEPRSRHCTPAWGTEQDSFSKKQTNKQTKKNTLASLLYCPHNERQGAALSSSKQSQGSWRSFGLKRVKV